MFKYALEGITAFSTAPLIFSSIIGLLFCLVAFLLIILIIVRTLVFGDPTSGWPSMVCIIFFVSGVQLFSLGIIGQYMSKSYLEIKHRPIYIIRETEKKMKNNYRKFEEPYYKERKRTLITFHLFKAFQSPYICSLTKIYKITCTLIKKMI